MTTYTDVFGGDTVPPSQSGYVAVALTADTTFFWPELASGADLMADIMEVTPDAAWSMTFPAANVVSTGRDVLVRNLGSDTITLKDSAGGTIGTVAAGVSKYLYITDNSTAAGLWTVFTFGTGTSATDAATLAGYGLVATGSTLSQQHSVVSSAVTRAVLASDRATVIMFTNSGTVDCDLPTVASVGNGFFVSVSNQGTGTVTIDGSGSETIDGETTKDLAPGESCTLVSNGVLWASIGYGRSTQFQFTKLVLDISTGSPFTLTSVQAQNKLIQTIGTITADVTINVPAVVAVYYIQCSHTGAFNTTFKTAAGAGVALDAGDRSILYCDGVDVVSAQTASAPAANLSGGAAGAVVYQSAVGVTSFASVGTSGQVFVSGGTGAPGWSDLGLITHAYSAKNPPVDADEFPLADSAASYGPKRILWSTIKSVIGYSAPSASKTTPVDADAVPLYDSAATTTATKTTWANVKATLKTYFDTLYATAAYISGLIGSTIMGYVAPGTSGNILTSNGSAWTSAAPPAGGAAAPLINGAFSINQRAAATNADDTYAHDRWYALTQTGTIAVSTLTDVEDTTPFMARLTQSQASAQRMGYAQIIEGKNCKYLRGQQVTFRFGRKRLSASANIRIAVLEWTGTEDSVTSDVVNDWTSGTYTAGNFFLASNLTVSGVVQQALTANTLADGSAVTVTLGSSFNNLIVFVWTEATAAQNVTLDLGKAQLEKAAIASAFVASDYESELAKCQRYYEVGVTNYYMAVGGTGYFGQTTFYRTTKRAQPTLVITDNAGTAGKITAITNSVGGSANGYAYFDNTNSGMAKDGHQILYTAGSSLYGYVYSWTAEKEL